MSETQERIHIQDGAKRMRTYLGGELLADTKRAAKQEWCEFSRLGRPKCTAPRHVSCIAKVLAVIQNTVDSIRPRGNL